tara:strand:+ start:1707 stop:2369 length:663 start_codon:yes stop_codon:yes gene_type:complete
MHKTVENIISIQNEIKSKTKDLKMNNYSPNIIAVSKTFSIDHIKPLIDFGHMHFGENKVQEAKEKWEKIKIENKNIILHMVGKLQSNKVKHALKIFDYIHSLDNQKLAEKLAKEKINLNKNPKIFIQVNIGGEDQKSGINKNHLSSFYEFCLKLNLNIIGLMCIPPNDNRSGKFFSEIKKLALNLNLNEISMGMSNDYIQAVENNATFLRIGSSIFGQRN